jgi:putative transposase
MSKRANERFQFDHTQLKVWGKLLVDGQWRLVRVYVSAALDEYSRAIAGLVVSARYPDAVSVAYLIRHAVRPKTDPAWQNKGIPQVIQPDRGRDFLSSWVKASCASMGTLIDPDPPHYPNRKGKVERFFRTMNDQCLKLMPGHKSIVGKTPEAAMHHLPVLLTVDAIRSRIERWVVDEYHQNNNSETGAAPARRWRDSVGIPLMPESDAALHLLLLKREKRTVRATGIEFRGVHYWHPLLAGQIAQDVTILYHDDLPNSVVVYEAKDHKFVCEATIRELAYTAKDMKAAAKVRHRELVAEFREADPSVRFGPGAPRPAQRRPPRLQRPAVPPPAKRVSPLTREQQELRDRIQLSIRQGPPRANPGENPDGFETSTD